VSETNPYQSPSVVVSAEENPGRRADRYLTLAAVAQMFVGGIGLLGSLYSLVFWGLMLFDANPQFSGEQRIPYAPQMIPISMLMFVQSVLIIGGAVSMFQQKRRWLAHVGAWAGISPFCGCYIFSLISGIWAMMVLRRPEVQALFAEKQPSRSE